MGDYHKELSVQTFSGGVVNQIKPVEPKGKSYNGTDKSGLPGRFKLGVLFCK